MTPYKERRVTGQGANGSEVDFRVDVSRRHGSRQEEGTPKQRGAPLDHSRLKEPRRPQGEWPSLLQHGVR